MYIMTEDGWQPLFRMCGNVNDLQGVYRPDTIEGARAETALRAEKFCALLEEGDIRSIKSFNPPMFGAFGERL